MAKRSEEKLTSLYERQAEICSALASPLRLQILDILADGEKTAKELLETLKIPKANLSQHLAVLKDAGIVVSRKEGLFQYMSLGIPKIKDACSIIRTVLYEKASQAEKKNSELIRELKSKR